MRGGYLVLSGILDHERDELLRMFAGGAEVVSESRDGEWVGLTMKKR